MGSDPFRYAACRMPDVDPRWWDHDANSDARQLAAAACVACPARDACALLRDQLDNDAVGTWAGTYRPWVDNVVDDIDAAFVAVFGAWLADTGAGVDQMTLGLEGIDDRVVSS